MLSKVKEFFNKMYKEEDSQRPQRNKKRRKLGMMPIKKFDIPDPAEDIIHFINCETSPSICPMIWEELEIDFEDKNRRYCKYCDDYVYKVENKYLYDQLKEENKCMAISEEFLNKYSQNFNDDYFIRLEKRLKLSKLFLIYKVYFPDEYKKYEDEKATLDIIFKDLIIKILKNEEKFSKDFFEGKGVDLEYIFKNIVTKLDYKFIKEIYNIINDIKQ